MILNFDSYHVLPIGPFCFQGKLALVKYNIATFMNWHKKLNFLAMPEFPYHKFMSVLPLISSSAQCDFFPFAASSVDIIVYIFRGSGGSYFSLGMPVELEKKPISTMKNQITEKNSF